MTLLVRRAAERDHGRRALPSNVSLFAIVTAAYAAGSLSSWLLFQASSAGAVFFPPAGVTLAALVLTPARRWIWVLAAAASAEFTIDVWQGLQPWAAAGFTLANVVEPLVGAALVRRLAPGPIDLTRRRDAGVFLTYAVGVGPVAGALVGATMIVVFMHPGWWAGLGQFWAGDALAVLTLGTAIVAIGSAPERPLRRWRRHAWVLPATAGLTVAGFWSWRVPLVYLPVPLVVGAGVRGHVGLVGLAGFTMAYTANLVTATGRGPWAVVTGQPRLEGASLQVYVAFIVVGAWALAIAVAERDRARAQSQRESRARRQLQSLQEVTARLAGAATVAEVIEVLTRDGAATLTGGATLRVTQRNDDGYQTWPPEPARGAGRRAALDRAAEVLRTKQPLTSPAALVVPVFSGKQCRAALEFRPAAGGVLPGEADSAARTLAALAGQAWQRAELFESEHDAAHQLQRSLLPTIMTGLPGVDAAARYRPANRGHDVGGDWYDVFALPGQRVGIVIGDVIGHGLTAAVAMSRLQQYVRWIAGKGASPAEVLRQLDELCASTPGADYVTVGYAEYSPHDGVLCHARAGHPPPLLVTGGTAGYLHDGLSEPLPAGSGDRRQAQTVVPPGAMLIWYSDGLVERRTETLDIGLDRLRSAAAGIAGTQPEQWCDRLLDAMTDGAPTGDDIVITCVRLDGRGASPGGAG
jgi:serine phosphatase RsbU (regulator of sigma subunit)/integral membrane sensor domain MASE1